MRARRMRRRLGSTAPPPSTSRLPKEPNWRVGRSMAEPPDTDPFQAPAPQADAVKEEASMEIHKPKPIHNWREFLTEIGVVVLGVCIALAAEQAVEAIHWHNKVVEARGVIATELAGNV